IGALKAYFYWPIFKLFGVSPLTIRLPAILLAALSLVFTYFFLKRAFHVKVARIATLLMAVDPSFVFHTKLDWWPVVIMLLLKMSSLYVLAFWVQTQHARYLALGGFLLGLALYNEVTFIWYLAGMSLAVGAVFGKDFFRYLTVRAVAVFSLFFV